MRVSAYIVRVSFDPEVPRRLCASCGNQGIQSRLRFGFQVVGVGVEQNSIKPGASFTFQLIHDAVRAPWLPVRARANFLGNPLAEPSSCGRPIVAVMPPIPD